MTVFNPFESQPRRIRIVGQNDGQPINGPIGHDTSSAVHRRLPVDPLKNTPLERITDRAPWFVSVGITQRVVSQDIAYAKDQGETHTREWHVLHRFAAIEHDIDPTTGKPQAPEVAQAMDNFVAVMAGLVFDALTAEEQAQVRESTFKNGEPAEALSGISPDERMIKDLNDVWRIFGLNPEAGARIKGLMSDQGK